jgi:hypothetical protein
MPSHGSAALAFEAGVGKCRRRLGSTHQAGLGPIVEYRLATGPEVLNDPVFGEVYQWAIPKLQLSRTVLQRDLF